MKTLALALVMGWWESHVISLHLDFHSCETGAMIAAALLVCVSLYSGGARHLPPAMEASGAVVMAVPRVMISDVRN